MYSKIYIDPIINKNEIVNLDEKRCSEIFFI